MEKQIIIPTINAQRLLKDIKQIMCNPLTDNGIYYRHDDKDMLKGYALIIGPEDTLYEYGAYLFEFNFPPNYPFEPPRVVFKTNNGETRFNPNLYKNGKVCISILNTWRGDQWSSCQNISTILLTLVTLLNNKPFLNEPGVTEQHSSYNDYNKIIRYENLNFSILKFLNKEYYPNGFKDFHDIFVKLIKEKRDVIKHKITTFMNKEKKETLVVPFYQMRVTINYESLFNKFNKIDI